MSSAQSNAPAVGHAPNSGGVTHIRHRHATHFTVVGNHLAQHRGLSATAIGIGVYIQSLPDGAHVGIKVLAAHFPESEYRIAAALRELEAAGYLRRTKVRTDGQRIVTRTTYFDCPGAQTPARASSPPRPVVCLVKPRRERPTPRRPEGPAADLLAGLRARDPRLTLSVRDVAALAPAVEAWLEREVPPEQVARTLSTGLPGVPIHRPARLLAHRLEQWLPPALPTSPTTGAAVVIPLQECDGCDRAFRSAEPGLCRECGPVA
ncbi:helix-turn-helix domain-containing protein [Streptomyces sp. NPDC059009]|uniref:helix-turn-helix domain-containing protein n=1 Tax=Streptomyces sp. NPDC059009 TaxID=3346694 RepID=UPI0036B771E1